MRNCTVCGKEFEPVFNTFQAVCGRRCAGQVGKIKRKAQARTLRDRKEAMKTLPDLKKEAQIAFNAYIRYRDRGKPCICCGKFPAGEEALTGGSTDAGHYRSRGSCPELAFDERNCHLQLARCNRFGWDVASYRAELIRRIGLAEVESLEGYHPPKKYTRSDMKAIRDTYRQKLKALQQNSPENGQ